MRQLVKAKKNLMNAELYAIEPTVSKDGRKLVCLTNEQVCYCPRPIHSGCRTNYSIGYSGCSPSAEKRIFEETLLERSASGCCEFEFIFNGKNYGRVQTPYHIEGKCLQNN